MRELIGQEVFKVYGGNDDSSTQEESPSLIEDFLLFVTYAAFTGGFTTSIITFAFTQSLPITVAATAVGIMLSVGACIAIEAALP